MVALALTAFSAFRGLFGGRSGSPFSLKTLGIVAGGALALLVGWQLVGFVRQARADAIAVSQLTSARDAAIAANDANLAALAASEKQHQAIVDGAVSAMADSLKRSADLEATLEDLSHAPRSLGCTPSPAARAALERLRG